MIDISGVTGMGEAKRRLEAEAAVLKEGEGLLATAWRDYRASVLVGRDRAQLLEAKRNFYAGVISTILGIGGKIPGHPGGAEAMERIKEEAAEFHAAVQRGVTPF